MPLLTVDFDTREFAALEPRRLKRAIAAALRKAGSTAVRDMRSEATKRVRKRKRLKLKYVREALHVSLPRRGGIDGMEWALNVSGKKLSLMAYGPRQTKRGVSVGINRTKRTVIGGAFLATMRSGHEGVFVRKGRERLPIRELFGSRPVDALLHEGEADAVAQRGARSLEAGFHRLLPIELGKLG